MRVKNEPVLQRASTGNTMLVFAAAQAGLISLKAFGVIHSSWWLITAPLWIASLGFLSVIVVLCIVGGYVGAAKGHLEQGADRRTSQHNRDVLTERLHRPSR
jgi:hypothetical protein